MVKKEGKRKNELHSSSLFFFFLKKNQTCSIFCKTTKFIPFLPYRAKKEVLKKMKKGIWETNKCFMMITMIKASD